MSDFSEFDLDWQGRPNYFDRQGNPITFHQWAVLRTPEAKRVALTYCDDGVVVSTVWIGMNLRLTFGDGPPLIFETMIFGGHHEYDCWREPTEAAALARHDQVVTAVNKGEEPS